MRGCVVDLVIVQRVMLARASLAQITAHRADEVAFASFPAA